MSGPAGREAKDEPVNSGIPPAKAQNRPRRHLWTRLRGCRRRSGACLWQAGREQAAEESGGLARPCPHSGHDHGHDNRTRASGKARHPRATAASPPGFRLALE